jgi:hypothetical protein
VRGTFARSAELAAVLLIAALLLVGCTTTQTRQETREVEIPFETAEETNAEAAVGQREVVQEGVPGLSSVTYEQTWLGDELQGEEVVSEEVITEPVDEIVSVGTALEEPVDLPPIEELQEGALAFIASADGPAFGNEVDLTSMEEAVGYFRAQDVPQNALDNIREGCEIYYVSGLRVVATVAVKETDDGAVVSYHFAQLVEEDGETYWSYCNF